MKRSSEPTCARCSITGVIFSLVWPDVEGAEPLGQVEVDLVGAALPFAADGVAQHIFELRPVEGALARVDRGRDALLRRPPRARGRARAPPRPRPRPSPTRFSGRVDSFTLHVVEAEVPIDRQDQFVDLEALGLDLLLGAEDVRVVLREGAHPHDAVQRARRLVAMDDAEFRNLQRQIAIALQPVLEDLHVAGAVHRLQREDAIVLRLGDEHVLAIGAPVA